MAYIINRHGILHSFPDATPLPVGARLATEKEVSEWKAQDSSNKAANRAAKQRRAEERAQLVVINGGRADNDDEPVAPNGGEKDKKDGK